jgi:hypothetical protein
MSLSQMRSFVVHHRLVFALFLSTLSTACYAQAIRARPLVSVSPKPALSILQSLSISVSPGTANFTLASGGVSNSQTVVITTSWIALVIGTDTLDIYGYFLSPTAALQNTTNSSYVIPSSAVYGQVTGTGSLVSSYTPFTATTPFGSASGLHLSDNTITLLLVLGIGSQTDNLAMRINLSGQSQVPAGSYMGTLTLQAVAN